MKPATIAYVLGLMMVSLCSEYYQYVHTHAFSSQTVPDAYLDSYSLIPFSWDPP
jgi:hypothetical protein